MKKRTRRQGSPDAARTAPSVSQFRPHPWHGLETGPEPPEVLNAFIEITPFDMMKYEIDKVSGYLRVDRPLLRLDRSRKLRRRLAFTQ